MNEISQTQQFDIVMTFQRTHKVSRALTPLFGNGAGALELGKLALF